jgi:Apea-like HEPN
VGHWSVVEPALATLKTVANQMDPGTDSIFAGVAGVETDSEHFDLGEGISIDQTFGHFMAPFLMAFAPAASGKPHPAPWSAVEGGLSIDFHVQLHVPAVFEIPGFYSRLNTVWWITALIRLRGAFLAHVPVIADRPFAEIPRAAGQAMILSVEALPRRAFAEPKVMRLSMVDLLWLKNTWREGGILMGKSSELNDAFQAFDSSGTLPSTSVAMLAIWGALEHLFSPAKQELRFRVSANIASFLERPGPRRLALHRKLMKLYDARSQVAHGTATDRKDAGSETYEIANRVLVKILETREVPSRESLDAALFAPE